ncbi:MAG: hypothetical protein JNM96_00540, partial [Bacteroidia bacterium]|nr:hypothetical protein [Bacteroidia bacterium]
TVNVSVSASNLLNKKYRDYLDRFRYFIDSPGQSFNFRLSIPFSLIN